jgi:hypothetical protein
MGASIGKMKKLVKTISSEVNREKRNGDYSLLEISIRPRQATAV